MRQYWSTAGVLLDNLMTNEEQKKLDEMSDKIDELVKQSESISDRIKELTGAVVESGCRVENILSGKGKV